MAKTKPAATDQPPVWKKGEVTIQGVNFNDAWARGLVPGKMVKDGPEMTAEELFLAHNKHHYKELSDEKRTELLKAAFKACLDAQ